MLFGFVCYLLLVVFFGFWLNIWVECLCLIVILLLFYCVFGLLRYFCVCFSLMFWLLALLVYTCYLGLIVLLFVFD